MGMGGGEGRRVAACRKRRLMPAPGRNSDSPLGVLSLPFRFHRKETPSAGRDWGARSPPVSVTEGRRVLPALAPLGGGELSPRRVGCVSLISTKIEVHSDAKSPHCIGSRSSEERLVRYVLRSSPWKIRATHSLRRSFGGFNCESSFTNLAIASAGAPFLSGMESRLLFLEPRLSKANAGLFAAEIGALAGQRWARPISSNQARNGRFLGSFISRWTCQESLSKRKQKLFSFSFTSKTFILFCSEWAERKQKNISFPLTMQKLPINCKNLRGICQNFWLFLFPPRNNGFGRDQESNSPFRPQIRFSKTKWVRTFFARIKRFFPLCKRHFRLYLLLLMRFLFQFGVTRIAREGVERSSSFDFLERAKNRRSTRRKNHLEFLSHLKHPISVPFTRLPPGVGSFLSSRSERGLPNWWARLSYRRATSIAPENPSVRRPKQIFAPAKWTLPKIKTFYLPPHWSLFLF